MAIFSSTQATANITNIRYEFKEPSNGREFINYQAYQEALGDQAVPLAQWQGDDMYWLRADREQNKHRWLRAIHLITFNQFPNYLAPFAQINSYYRTMNFWIKGHKHTIQWQKGAYYLVKDLTQAYYAGITNPFVNALTPTDTLALLQSLNLAIVNFAITQFYRLLYGEFAKVPQTGAYAWAFDREFINIEQGPVAFQAYSAATASAREEINEIFNDQPKLSLAGLTTVLKDLDPTGVLIPVFPTLYNSDITQNTTANPNYGEQARIAIPLAMLYPNSTFYDDPQFIGTPFATTLVTGQAKVIGGRAFLVDGNGNAIEPDFDVNVYGSYAAANNLINALCNSL